MSESFLPRTRLGKISIVSGAVALVSVLLTVFALDIISFGFMAIVITASSVLFSFSAVIALYNGERSILLAAMLLLFITAENGWFIGFLGIID